MPKSTGCPSLPSASPSPAFSLHSLWNGRADQRGVHDRAAPHHPSRLFQAAVDGVNKQLVDPLFLQQIPEVQQSRGIRDVLLKKVDSHESEHGIAVINGVFYTLVGQIEPALHQIHPQHSFNLNGWTAQFSGGLVRHNQRYPFVPWDNIVHSFRGILSVIPYDIYDTTGQMNFIFVLFTACFYSASPKRRSYTKISCSESHSSQSSSIGTV